MYRFHLTNSYFHNTHFT